MSEDLKYLPGLKKSMALLSSVLLIFALYQIITWRPPPPVVKKAVRIEQTEALSIVEDVTMDYPKELEALTKDPAPEEKIPFSLSLYVDQSQSMRGYIPPIGGNRFYDGSNFIALLHALGHQGELNRLTNAKSFGSGLPPGAPNENLPRVVDLMKPDQKDYNLLSNDYASLIDEIMGRDPDRRNAWDPGWPRR